MTNFGGLAVGLVALMALGGCNTLGGAGSGAVNTGVGAGQVVGTGAGAIAGGLIGSQIGSGSGQVAATIGGAVLGGLLGGSLGASIDANDRERARKAQLVAVSEGRATSWRAVDSDAYGSIEPGDTYTGGSGTCREYTHTIFIGGRPKRATGTACQTPTGDWEVVS